MNRCTNEKVNITISRAKTADLDELHRIEELCFGSGKAASREAFLFRLTHYPQWFLKASIGRKTAGLINGCPSDQKYITDNLYLAESTFNLQGENLLIFGLAVHPEFRKLGIAHALMDHILKAAREGGKKRVSLSCKESLVPFYEGFGYTNHGASDSTIGGIKFFDMEMEL